MSSPLFTIDQRMRQGNLESVSALVISFTPKGVVTNDGPSFWAAALSWTDAAGAKETVSVSAPTMDQMYVKLAAVIKETT